MSKISPFAIHKTLIGIGGEPKSVKRLRSGDLLIETMSDLQTKSFLLAKTFFNSPVTVSPHKTLNSCRGVIFEPDLLSTPDAEILEGFSDQGVIQVRRITIKRDSNIIPTKHIILTFNKPKLPTTVKAGYLHCNLLPSPSVYYPRYKVSRYYKYPSLLLLQLLPPDNNLNTLVSPLETETRSRTPPAKLDSVSTENLHESVPNESNSEHSTAAEAKTNCKTQIQVEENAQKYRNQISK
ncbi:RNA-directed DNA polymerase from mobile element jockey [Trichonephila clavipes]|nr:RNA-directed DNA polymerase from mobile element jockey [Trichonephila clavipes]